MYVPKNFDSCWNHFGGFSKSSTPLISSKLENCLAYLFFLFHKTPINFTLLSPLLLRGCDYLFTITIAPSGGMFPHGSGGEKHFHGRWSGSAKTLFSLFLQSDFVFFCSFFLFKQNYFLVWFKVRSKREIITEKRWKMRGYREFFLCCRLFRTFRNRFCNKRDKQGKNQLIKHLTWNMRLFKKKMILNLNRLAVDLQF